MKKVEFQSDFKSLGTDINIQIVLENKEEASRAKKDANEIRELFSAKEKIFSRFNPESELNRLNKNLGVCQKASPDILYLSRRALYYNKMSGGLYDPRIIEVLEQIGYNKDFKAKDFSKMDLPPVFSATKTGLSHDLKIEKDKVIFARRMDFSGIAKGYITDCAAEFLKKQGWKNFLVDSGGDMRIIGKNADGEKWRIEIEGIPEKKLMLELSEVGIATSGISRKKWQINGKKFHHLVNPKNPNHFSYELRMVSVVAKNTENADGRAKTLVLMGKQRGLEFAKKNKIAAVFLDYRGDVFLSPATRKYISGKS
jgi:thiamine biosynthesis lipoprotein